MSATTPNSPVLLPALGSEAAAPSSGAAVDGPAPLESHRGSTIADLEQMVSKVGIQPVGYTRVHLHYVIRDLEDAASLTYFQLLKFGYFAATADHARGARTCYHVYAYLQYQISQWREILKTCCPHCEMAPCQFDCSRQLSQYEAQRVYDAGNV